MKRRIAELALWTIALSAMLVAVFASRRMLRGEDAATPIVWPAPQPNASASPDSIAQLGTRIVHGDVFRVDRKPAAVPTGWPAIVHQAHRLRRRCPSPC